MLVRQEDVACRHAISQSNLCWLHELIITHRLPGNPCLACILQSLYLVSAVFGTHPYSPLHF